MLDASSISPHKTPDKHTLTETIVKARLEDGVVTFTRPQMQQRLDDCGVTRGTIRNRLRELVELGLLSVDTTGATHKFTLAVPVEPPAVGLETWIDDLESFTPTEWDGLSTVSPTHADIVGEEDALAHLDGQAVVPEWLCQDDSATDAESAAATAIVASNPYARYAIVTLGATFVTLLGGIFAIHPLGYYRVGLFLFGGFLVAFSACVPLSVVTVITAKWRNPADVRPSDLLSVVREQV